MSNENNDLLKLKGVSHYKFDGLNNVRKSAPRNEGQGNCHVNILPREGNEKAVDVRKEGTLASDMNVCSSIPALGNDAKTVRNPGGSQNFLMKSAEEVQII